MAKFENSFKYFLVALNLLISFGALIYFFYALNTIGIFISLFLSTVSFFGIKKWLKSRPEKTLIKPKKNNAENFTEKKSFFLFIPAAIYLLLLSACLYILFQSSSTNAIVSPWQNVPAYFFILYFLLSSTLLLIINRDWAGKSVLIFLHYLLSFSIALIVYKIGYGFDPFIHEATMKLISENGAVEPKPFYYLGQYALIVIIHKIFFIPIELLNKILVPLFAGALLFLTLSLNLEKWLEDKKIIRSVILLLLVLPFSFMIVSTPQNLAYVFFILTILFGLNCRQALDRINLGLLSLAAFFIHPIAGIPALLFAVILSLRGLNLKRKKIFYATGFALLSFALPLAFYLAEKLNRSAGTQNAENGTVKVFSEIGFRSPGQENIIINSLYLFIFNLPLLYILLAAAGFLIALKYRKKCRILFIYFFAFLGVLGSYLLVAKIPFAFLIEYERSDYAERTLTLASLLLLPFAILALYGFVARLQKQNKFIQIAFSVFFGAVLCASLYGSYPRFDNYHNSRGYSVSDSDIAAAEWIDQDANGDYIVLANQQVSVAALKTFGFKKYFTQADSGKEIFYYPIPTGEKLYQYYLDMVYKKPDRETINKAMNYTGVETAYFVLNKYWWAAPKILAEAELESDSKHEINQGEISIFKYQKTKNAPY